MQTENYRPYMGVDICRNYGGYVVVDGYDYNIYKTYADAKAAVRRKLDGTNKKKPEKIGRMNRKQFVDAFRF